MSADITDERPPVRGPGGRGFLWGGMVLVVAGCTHAPSRDDIPSQTRRHPPLLVSELRRAADPAAVIDSIFVLQNPGSEPAVLRFDAAGCSCYGVFWEGERLQTSQTRTIPPRSQAAVRIDVPRPDRHGEPQFSARFSRLRPGGIEEPLTLTLTAPILPDAFVTPEVLTVGYRPGEPLAPLPLRLTRVARNRDAVETPPLPEPPPPFVSLEEWRQVALDQPATGLWQSVWETEVRVDLPRDDRNEHQALLRVQPFVETAAGPVEVRLLVRPRVGIRAPQIVALGTWSRTDPPRQRRVLLTSADQLPFRIREVRSSDDRCRAEAGSGDPSVRQWLTIEVRPDRDGEIDAELRCTTDHPESPTVVLHVQGRIRPPGASAAE